MDKWPAYARLLDGRSGRPLTHSLPTPANAIPRSSIKPKRGRDCARNGGRSCERFDNGREFGLAFASAHSIHLGLVIWLYQISAAPPLSDAMAAFFSVGLLWTYLLALFSIQRLSGMLGAKLWRGMRLVGLEYIMLAFQADFVPGSLHADPKHLITYVPFAALGLAGTGMRIVSWMKKMRQPSQTAIGTDSLRQTHGA